KTDLLCELTAAQVADVVAGPRADLAGVLYGNELLEAAPRLGPMRAGQAGVLAPLDGGLVRHREAGLAPADERLRRSPHQRHVRVALMGRRLRGRLSRAVLHVGRVVEQWLQEARLVARGQQEAEVGGVVDGAQERIERYRLLAPEHPGE